jgi:hypothetical protein
VNKQISVRAFGPLIVHACLFVALVLTACLLSPTAQMLAANSAASTTRPVSASELVKEIIAAYGGIDVLKTAQDSAFHSQAKVNVFSAISGANNSFPCDIYGKGEQVRIETVVIGQKTTMAYDGKTCWTQTGDWIAPSTETIAKEIGEEVRHSLNQLITLADPKSKLTLNGTKVIQDKTCDVLQAIAIDGKPTTFYLDPQTHLVLRSEYMGVDREQNVPAIQATDYEDYRPVAGTFMPFKSIDYSGGKKVSESLLDKMDMGIQLSDDYFKMPPASEVAEVKDKPVEIPFDYVANKIIVKMRLNRQNTYNFILDTGASQTVLDKSVAQSLGPITSSEFAITTGAKAVNLSYTTLPTVSLGSITLDNISALVTDLSALRGQLGEGTAGLLGANILKRFLVTIDFQNKTLILANPHKVTIPDNATVITTSPIFGATALVVPAKIDNKLTVNFLVDTGASFNNLPASAAKVLLSQPLLSVGQISGLDNQKLHIGSCRFHSLKLGSATIANPIFAITPDAGGGESSGLFTAGSLGILGMPVWSHFTITIDYPGERMILLPVPDKEELDKFLTESAQINLQMLQTKNVDKAATAYEKMASSNNSSPNAQLYLAVAYSGLGNCFFEKYKISKDNQWLTKAKQSLAAAADLAQAAHQKELQAHIFAQLAYLYIVTSENDPASLQSAQRLLGQANVLAPMDSYVSAVTSTLLSRVGQTATADKLLDQALMLDPSDWLALWTKYKHLISTGNTADKALIVAQLNRYYPNVPEVLALSPGSKPSPAAKKATPKKKH